MREHLLKRIRPLRLVVGLAGLLVVFAIATQTVAAQTVARTYERLSEQERVARAAPATPVATLRTIARSYESLVQRYPTSGYSDNALWQAAGLRQLAFERGTAAADRDEAIRLLAWLEREYPHSPLIKQIEGRRVALGSVQPSTAAAPSVAAGSAGMTEVSVPLKPPAAPVVSTQAPAANANSPTVIRSITRTTLPKGDRIVIELSREATFTGDRVDNPDRVFFDFSGTALSASASQAVSDISGTFVKSMRLGRHASGVVRVVMEMNGAPRYSTFPLYNPFRLVIDVEGDAPLQAASGPALKPVPPPPSSTLPANVVSPIAKPPTEILTKSAVSATVLRDLPPPPAPVPAPVTPASTGRGDYSLARQLGLSVSRVVIDAGHGGHDPGAQSNGVKEAEVVLDISQRLAALLRQQPGFEVVLTRDSDVFIPLEERTALANREGADLFLSIHVNAARNTGVRGIETYLLNFATNPQAEAVAARENASSAQTMGTLPAILKAIALNSKLKESRELATHTQTSLVRRLSTQNKGTRDLGVKQAPFVVLIGAEMPSVLAEIAFLTNKAEASLLKQSSYRQSIAQALCDGILRYQASLKKVTTIAGSGDQR